MKKLVYIFYALFLIGGLGLSAVAQANELDAEFDYVGVKAGIDADLLRAISIVESKMDQWALNCYGKGFHPSTIREAYRIIRKQGLRCDVGLMQVNYSYNGYRMKLSIEDLFDPRININAAANILKENMIGTDNAWVAVGRYHNWTDKKRSANYSRRVYNVYMRLKNMKGG